VIDVLLGVSSRVMMEIAIAVTEIEAYRSREHGKLKDGRDFRSL
jgi:hypothetical protein